MVQREVDILDYTDEDNVQVAALLGSVSDPDLAGPSEQVHQVHLLDTDSKLASRLEVGLNLSDDGVSGQELVRQLEGLEMDAVNQGLLGGEAADPDFEPEGLVIIPGDQPLPAYNNPYARQGVLRGLGVLT